MTIFLTGSTGFVGKALLNRLIQEGHTVHCHYRGQPIDLDDTKIVIHCAAEIYKEEEMLESNVIFTYRLLEEAEVNKISKFIYFGSSSEYGHSPVPMRETDSLKPTIKYESTKGAGSLFVMASPLNTTIIRPFSVYGPGEPKRRFLPTVYDKLQQKNGEISVTPWVHDFIYIDDLVNVTMIALNLDKGIINVGSGKQHTNIEVVNLMEKITGKTIRKIPNPVKLNPCERDTWMCDTTYLRSIYPKPLVEFEDGLTRYVQHRRETNTY